MMNFIKKNWITISVILLLFVMALILIVSAKEDSLTADEGVYISAGYVQYKYQGDIINLEHPPLFKYIIGLPIIFLKPNISDQAVQCLKQQGEQYELAHEFLYNSENDADKMIFYGRLSIVILTIILGIVIFCFSSYIFNSPRAGLLSLFFYSLSPNIIAHGHLATNDFLLTFFFFLTVISLYFYFKNPSWKNLLITTLFFSAAILAKFSALILAPIILLIFIIKSFQNKKEILKFIIHFILAGVLSLLVITLFYYLWGSSLKIYYEGASWQAFRSTKGGLSYLFGNYSKSGWWYYYILAFLIKTPVATIILFIISITFWIIAKFKDWKENLVLIIPPIVLFIILLGSKINIGLRYALPIYPFIFLAIGFLVQPSIIKHLWIKIILAVCCVWYFISFIIITPYQLTYFNELIGGPKNGYKYLVDSNIDWGQDLKRLKKYMDENNIDRINLAYFGNTDPDYYGINYTKMQYPFNQDEVHGYVAISVQHLAVPLGYVNKLEDDMTGFAWLKNIEPVDRLGNSLYVYYVE